MKKTSNGDNQQKGRKISIINQIKEMIRKQMKFNIIKNIKSLTNQ